MTTGSSLLHTAIHGDLQTVSAQIAELNARLEVALTDLDADPDHLQRLLAELRAAETARDRLRSALLVAQQRIRNEHVHSVVVPVPDGGPRPAQRRVTMSVREQVLAGLELLGVPAAPRTVAEAAYARTGLPVDARQL